MQRRDPALLEINPAAGEAVDHLREGRLVTDDRAPSRRGHEPPAARARQRGEPVGERGLDDRLDVEARARELGRLPRPHLGARVTGANSSLSAASARPAASAWCAPRGSAPAPGWVWTRGARPRRVATSTSCGAIRAASLRGRERPGRLLEAPVAARAVRDPRPRGARRSAPASPRPANPAYGVRSAQPSGHRSSTASIRLPPNAPSSRTTTISTSPPSNGYVSTTCPTATPAPSLTSLSQEAPSRPSLPHARAIGAIARLGGPGQDPE